MMVNIRWSDVKNRGVPFKVETIPTIERDDGPNRSIIKSSAVKQIVYFGNRLHVELETSKIVGII